MCRHIRIFVKNQMFHDSVLPSLTNRRFHPKRKDVRNHIYSAEVKLKFAKLDQANLDLKVQEWEIQVPDDLFSFGGMVRS